MFRVPTSALPAILVMVGGCYASHEIGDTPPPAPCAQRAWVCFGEIGRGREQSISAAFCPTRVWNELGIDCRSYGVDIFTPDGRVFPAFVQYNPSNRRAHYRTNRIHLGAALYWYESEGSIVVEQGEDALPVYQPHPTGTTMAVDENNCGRRRFEDIGRLMDNMRPWSGVIRSYDCRSDLLPQDLQDAIPDPRGTDYTGGPSDGPLGILFDY